MAVYQTPWLQDYVHGFIQVSIDGETWTPLPDAKRLKPSIYDLDSGENAGRGLDGYMHRDRVAIKEKLEMEFTPMWRVDVKKILALIKPQSFYVKFYSAYYGQNRIAEMYVGDRNYEYYNLMTGNDTDIIENLKFNFIER